jgi:cyclopropane-fatty-acyl-phospholipid synthase
MNLTSLIDSLVSNLVANYGTLPFAFVVHTPAGASIRKGEGTPVFELYIRNTAGLNALKSLSELRIVEAYLKDDIDIQEDLIKAIYFQDVLFYKNFWLSTWQRFKLLFLGRKKCNPEWIAMHYDADHIQLIAADGDYNTYTPGIYEQEEDSLEVGAERKLAFAFHSLNLQPYDSVLDIGCGWGGFLRYAARRQIQVTGITLSRHQHQYVEQLIRDNHFNAEVWYHDFFSFQSAKQYDGITMMGVMEDLSDYPRVMKKVSTLVKPGGRIYLDFASAKDRFGTGSFITKYIWPGTFRMVFMPQFIDAVRESPLELMNIYNDRRNYYLWSKAVNERWEQRKVEVVKQTSEQVWRLFRILYAGTASVMSRPSYYATAYRVVLELPADFAQG